MTGRVAVLDTQLLLPFVVGMTDPRYLASVPRTRGITHRVFEVIVEAIRPFTLGIPTPVLTEVDDFLRPKAVKGLRHDLVRTLLSFADRVVPYEVGLPRLARLDRYLVEEFGVADAAVLLAADDGLKVFTRDWRLRSEIAGRGGNVTDPLVRV